MGAVVFLLCLGVALAQTVCSGTGTLAGEGYGGSAPWVSSPASAAEQQTAALNSLAAGWSCTVSGVSGIGTSSVAWTFSSCDPAWYSGAGTWVDASAPCTFGEEDPEDPEHTPLTPEQIGIGVGMALMFGVGFIGGRQR
jgi:hypothetical protein